MATHVKPGERYATSDWFTASYVISTDAERQRVASHETRQESHYLRNATFNRTKWDQYDNNTRLADRVDHIRKSVLSPTPAVANEWVILSLIHISEPTRPY